MITRIKIDGFKSFSDFEVELKPFNVIVGANGSGKSNLLDALKLLRDLSNHDINTAFAMQRGSASELFTIYPDNTTSSKITIELDLLLDKSPQSTWKGIIKDFYRRVCYTVTIAKDGEDDDEWQYLFIEREVLVAIPPDTDSWLRKNISSDDLAYWQKNYNKEKANYYIVDNSKNHYEYENEMQDTLVDLVVLKGIHRDMESIAGYPGENMIAIHQFLQSIKLLNLDPKVLRTPSEKLSSKSVGEDGANLAATLYRIQQNEPYIFNAIKRKLSLSIPNCKGLEIIRDSVLGRYYIQMQGNDNVRFNARLLSEGTLRLLAMITLYFDDNHKGVLCLEEPENGVHPFRLSTILKLLKDLSTDLYQNPDEEEHLRQVIINTHSPILLSKAMELDGDIQLLYSQMPTLVDPHNKRSMRITAMYPIHTDKSKNKTTITLEIGEKQIYAKQVIDYLNTAHSEQL